MENLLLLDSIAMASSGGLIIQLILSAVSLFVAARYMPGIHLDDFTRAGVLAIILSFLNATIGSFLDMFNVFSLDLIRFAIDAAIILLAARFMKGFRVQSFWWALGLAIVVSLCNSLLYRVLF